MLPGSTRLSVTTPAAGAVIRVKPCQSAGLLEPGLCLLVIGVGHLFLCLDLVDLLPGQGLLIMELLVALVCEIGHGPALFCSFVSLFGGAHLLDGIAVIDRGKELTRLHALARPDMDGRHGSHDAACDVARDLRFHRARRLVVIADLRELHGSYRRAGYRLPLHLRRAGAHLVAAAREKRQEDQGRETAPAPFHLCRFVHRHSFFSSCAMPRSLRIVPLSQPRLRMETR